MRVAIHEFKEAMSAIEVYKYDNRLAGNDELVEWVMDVVHPAFELGSLIDPDSEWWFNAEAAAAQEREHAKWLLARR